MKINIKQLAKLTNIILSKKQEEAMEDSIPSVVSYMDEIKNLDVDDVSGTNAVIEEENIFREDVAEPSLSQNDALKNAKRTHNGFFVVKAIFGE